MSENIIMPQLGETVAEGKIVSWFKKVGDAVAEGDRLFEVDLAGFELGRPIPRVDRLRGCGQQVLPGKAWNTAAPNRLVAFELPPFQWP